MDRVRCSVAVALLAWAGAGAALSRAPAAGTVESLHAALLENMQQRLSCPARMDRLAPVIRRSFDLPVLARELVRRHWDQLAPAQRLALQSQVAEYTIAEYGSAFAHFSGERFAVLETSPLPRGNHRVRARVERPQGPGTSLDYVLHPADDGWRIVNVIRDGVSELAVRGRRYDGLLRDKGFAGLLAHLKQETERIKAQCGGESAAPLAQR